MPINFDNNRWERIRENSKLWWEGKLKRPLIHMTAANHDPGRSEPPLPYEFYTSAYDLSVPAEAVIDRIDYNLSCNTYYGDSFPHFMPFFGAGVLAAFLGAQLNQREETCWFHPLGDPEASDVSFFFNPENRWFKRIGDIYKAGHERWGGQVQLGMTDLGGSLDVVASFRPGEKLLLDLYDHPGEIQRLAWETHDVWWHYYDSFNGILQTVNQGYTAWTPLFSDGPYYMLQCDFCYMISPDMFDEFVKPELAASCKRLKNAFYHLDGSGQLAHLDSLLSIDELRGIQWVPGEGAPGMKHWPEVFRKIRDADKLIQFFGDIDDLDVVVEQLGSPEGIAVICMSFDNPRTMPSESDIIDALERYGVGD